MRIAAGILVALTGVLMAIAGLITLLGATAAGYGTRGGGIITFLQLHSVATMITGVLAVVSGIMCFVDKAKGLVLTSGILVLLMPLSLLVVTLILGGRLGGLGILEILYLLLCIVGGIFAILGAMAIGKPPTAGQLAMIGAPAQGQMYGPPAGMYGGPGGPPPGGGPGYGPPGGGGYGGPPGGGGYGGPPGGGGYGGPPGGGGGYGPPPGGGGYGPPPGGGGYPGGGGPPGGGGGGYGPPR